MAAVAAEGEFSADAVARLSRPTLLRNHAYVNGDWLDHSHRQDVFDPATGDRLGSVPFLGEREAEDAVSAAEAALSSWRRLTAGQRSVILKRWHGLIMANDEDLAAIITLEQGKPFSEALAEVRSAAAYIEWFAEEARRVYGDVIPGYRPGTRLFVSRTAVGVVSAITPWNFPAAMVARKVAPALAVGCTIVLKPSELTPFSALALALLAQEAGVPAGVLNVVTGDRDAIGGVLTGDPRVRKFTFTGSTAVGKMLAARCAGTVKRVSLELGGNAPFIVFDDADLDAAVDGAMLSKFRNSGQTCVCANRFYIQAGIYDIFVERLSQRIGALVTGNGFDAATTQGPLIGPAAIAKVQRHVSDALERGGRLVVGGMPSDGRHFSPTLIADVVQDSLLCREEIFGPVVGLIRFTTDAEVVALANSGSAGLAAYAYTCDLARAHRLGEDLEYGMVGINTGLMTTEVAPFGGVKASGIGREGSRYGIDDYVEIKTLCIDVGVLA